MKNKNEGRSRHEKKQRKFPDTAWRGANTTKKTRGISPATTCERSHFLGICRCPLSRRMYAVKVDSQHPVKVRPWLAMTWGGDAAVGYGNRDASHEQGTTADARTTKRAGWAL